MSYVTRYAARFDQTDLFDMLHFFKKICPVCFKSLLRDMHFRNFYAAPFMYDLETWKVYS